MSKRRWVMAAVAVATLGACGGGGAALSLLPSYIVAASILDTDYDGVSDDLLTGGLGQAGLQTGPAPALSATPTRAELRKRAIFNNYRALVDVTANGGYGSLYGPAVGVGGDGKVAGTEVLAYSDDGTGQRNVTLMVQVPASFDPARPCITTATSSGSRGVYGPIAAAEWGLKRGCAVAFTDKGTGGAPYDVMNDTVALIDGTRTTAATAGAAAHFRAPFTGSRAVFNTNTPNRFAFKHAHSQRNPEKDWGVFTLQAVEFAFWVLNQLYSPRNLAGEALATIRPSNTLVIASSVSNGGGAALAAAEADIGGLIDAVVVSEPQMQLPANLAVSVQRGGATPAVFARTLYDYASFANLFGPCAALSAQLAGTPFQAGYATTFGAVAGGRCAALQAAGLLSAGALTTAAQADESLDLMRNYGWEPESVDQYASFSAFEVTSAVTVTYANAYSRSGVEANLCGYSFAATLGAPTLAVTPLAAASLNALFSDGNGIPPGGGVQLVNNNVGGGTRDVFSTADMNFAGANCLHGLQANPALQTGVGEVRRNANLRGKPAIIVHGRADALVPVNHTSRPYTALNKSVEGAASRLSYIEVANAQHFDAFIGNAALAGYDTRYVPLHLYLQRGLDAMWAHFNGGAVLPPSQVVRGVPRGGTPGAAPAITAANVPPIAAQPAAGNAITFANNTLSVPN